MRLQNIFSKDEFKICLEKIKRKEFFDISVKRKPYAFNFEFMECDNGLWKDNLMCSIRISYKSGGYIHPMQIEELPKDYEAFCKIVNDYWLSEEKWYGDFKENSRVIEGQLKLFD